MKFKELSNDTLLFPLHQYFCCEWSEDDKIFIVNSDGIDIHHFKPNPKSKQPYPEFQRSFIFPITTNPTENSGFDPNFILYLSKLDLFRALSDPLVTPQFSFNPPNPGSFKKASWSSSSVLPSGNCLLAALNCLGSITIWNYMTGWSAVLDVSYLVYLHIKQHDLLLPLTKDETESLDNVMINCKQLACSGFTWSDTTFVEDNQRYSYFVTAQKSGVIYIWKLTAEEIDEKVTLNTLLEFQCPTRLEDICEIHWITFSDSIIYLVLGTNKGIVTCVCIIKTGPNLEFLKIIPIWEEEDEIAVAKISSIKWDEKSYFGLIVKGTFLISFSIYDKQIVSNIQHKNFGNLNITGLQCVKDREFYMCTLTGSIFHIIVKKNNKNIPFISSSIIESELGYNKYAQHGLCISKNNALCVMLLNPSKRVARFHGKRWSKWYVAYIDDIETIKLLSDNESAVLTNHWDVLELIRVLKVLDLYKNLQIKSLMNVNNCKTLYELKLCLWLNHIWYNTLEIESTIKVISKEILAHHATKHLKKIAQKYVQTSQLSDIDIETVSLQYKLIKTDLNNDNVLLTLKNLPQIVMNCEWCDEELVYPICSQNHLREFCCVTFRNVDSCKLLICQLCNAVANIDLIDESPLCTFCDSRLKYLPLCGDQKEEDDWKENSKMNMTVDDENITVENMEV